jgi:hypothetical protein
VVTFAENTATHIQKSPWYHFQFHQEADSPYLYKFAQDQWFLFDAQNLLKI